MASKFYFDKTHQQAILDYVATTDRNKRQEIYINILEPVFEEMVSKVIYTFKFASLPNIEIEKQNIKINLITLLNGFDVTKGSTAFAYFSVIIKNYFIQ